MTLTTDIIRFDLRNRGRKHTGKKRSYETVAGAARVAAIVNSPTVQERVKAGDMKGFLGHLPRQLAETPYPPECAVVEGRLVSFEPAFRTILLRATPDGVIEHQAEFLDTPPGRIAARQWQNRDGGFSAIIDDGMADGFYGFDYVQEPNFVFNRGWQPTMDSARPGGGVALDSAIREYNEAMSGADRMMAALQAQYDELLHAHARISAQFDSLSVERDDLLNRLARADLARKEEQAFQKPLMIPADATRRFMHDLAAFDSARLPRTQAPGGDTKSPAEVEYERMLRHAGLGRLRG
jgi:hypothetical protein